MKIIKRRVAKKIRILSRILKYACILGMLLFPAVTFIYWFFDHSKIQLINNWYIQFSDVPSISLNKLTLHMRLVGIFIDLIPCTFFVAVLFILSKLFKQYEHLYFFGKRNIQYIRWVAILLFCKTIIYPFYLALRNLIFYSSSPTDVILLFAPYEFKTFFIILVLVLLAYIMEVALTLEEDLIGTI